MKGVKFVLKRQISKMFFDKKSKGTKFFLRFLLQTILSLFTHQSTD